MASTFCLSYLDKGHRLRGTGFLELNASTFITIALIIQPWPAFLRQIKQ